MKQKSYLIGLFFTLSSFAFVTVVKATNQWEPMVEIPGIPTTGINLSTYLVGLYNFMLSVVGIVAVMMLILAGMRYITSAGNQGALTDAKSMAGNAIVGLLLALFSFVILKTINPDVLYLKKPGGTYGGGIALDLGACGRFTTGSCQCNDGSTPFATIDQDECHTQCSDQSKCTIAVKTSCVGPGSSDYPAKIISDKVNPNYGINVCFCADRTYVVPTAEALIDTITNPPDTCEQICGDHTGTLAVDGGYHGTYVNLRYGTSVNTLKSWVQGDPPVQLLTGQAYAFDLSTSSDCTDGILHYALAYDGTPGMTDTKFCCTETKNCGFLWGTVCILGTFDCVGNNPIGLEEYVPADLHTWAAPYTGNIWMGISIDNAGCTEYEKTFAVKVTDP